MDEYDAYPIKENGHQSALKNKAYNDDALIKRTSAQKQQVTKWQREELEDRYLRLYEENLILKKHARKQEDKIKRMATKLLRLVNDKKKSEQSSQVYGVKKVRDIETEEVIEELQGKVRQLEKQNNQLKEKLIVTRQQLALTASQKPGAYGHVQSRIHTGIPKTPTTDPRISKQLRVTGPLPGGVRGQHSPSYQRAGGHTALDQTRQENRRLEHEIASLNEQIAIYIREADMLREQLQMREAEFNEDLLKVKQQVSAGQRTTIQENIDIIKLQREVKEKSAKMTQLQALYANLEDKLRTVKHSHDTVLMEMETLNDQLKSEQNRVITLQNQLKSGSGNHRQLIEFQERCSDLERECEILREANEKLVASAFDLEREREWKQRENALKVQIAQLEATLRADVGEKGSILDVLTAERDEKDRLEGEIKDIRQKYFQTKHENDELRDKMRFFSSDSETNYQEIEEALMIVKKRKEKESQELSFLTKVDEELGKDAERVIRELRAEHADTCNELEKTRNLLITQHKINKDYQQEVEAVTQKMEDMRKEYDTKLDEYAALLDIRANRIKKLEGQLRDVAYGTRQYRIQPIDAEELGSDAEDAEDETVTLERGENLFEIHIKRLQLSPEALHELGDEEPQVFGTWEFYEHEVHATPVLRGPRADYEFTSQYIVKVDDFFLHYLQKDSCTFELHQSFGTDYRTVAACQLKMRDILDKPQGRLHATVQLIGMLNGGTNFGLLEYWVRLKVPMEQALRLFKERTKALGYIDSNIHATQQALQALDENVAKRPPDNVNQLSIKLIRANDVLPRREGVQPSPFAVYKFFDFADHATITIPGSNQPQFNDHQIYNVPMTVELDKYLKTQSLLIYVFDDTDPDQTSYLGCAKVQLIYLAHDKHIKDHFQLFAPDGSHNGTIDLSMKWKFNYIPPKAGTRTQAQILASGVEVPDQIPLLPGEEDALKESVTAGSPGTLPRAPTGQRPSTRSGRGRTVPRQTGPAAVSTPASKRVPAERDADMVHDISVIEQHIIPDQQVSAPVEPVRVERSMSQASVVSEGTPVPGEDDIDESLESTPRNQEPESVQQPETSGGPEELVAEELEETVKSGAPLSDTMFGDAKEGESDRESARSRITNASETESDVVCPSPGSRLGSQSFTAPVGDQVEVSINHLALEPDSEVVKNPAISKLFVEYRFLGVNPEETECPYALPKPKPYETSSFNFTKIFHVDFDNHYERRQYLASMLLPDDPDHGQIAFTVVSEPEGDDGDCEDIGRVYASIRDIQTNQRDLVDRDLEIYDINDPNLVIGHLNVTIKCLDVLKAIQMEMTRSSQQLA